jgi:alpha-ketoglutarate-dependent taurine dioxygenase
MILSDLYTSYQQLSMNNNYKRELEEKGWVEIDTKLSDDGLLSLAETFGKILPHPNGKNIDIIIPKKSEQAIQHSFSYRFGFNSFPLHSDTSFWTIPARYILLTCENTSKTATTIITFKQVLEKLNKEDLIDLEQAIYLVKIKNKTFFSKLKQQFGNQICYRYDSSTMKPLNKHAKKIEERLNEVFESLNVTKINWNSNKIIILDNWQTLHGREPIREDLDRKLKKIYIQ